MAHIFDSDILKQIIEIERNQQRSIADLVADPNDQEARRYFNERKARIAELRDQMHAKRSPPVDGTGEQA